MTDRSDEEILGQYASKGLAGRVGFGHRSAVLVVDLILGFTEVESPLGSDLDAVVEATARLLSVAREAGAPILYTTTSYGPGSSEAGHFLAKIPSLEVLQRGSRWTELDPRLGREREEVLVDKQYASAFFGTSLASTLNARRVDTLLICGATTSGCIRASVVDALQHGFRPIVPRECVGDRAEEPHRANLLDIDGKYGDVMSLDQVIDHLRGEAS